MLRAETPQEQFNLIGAGRRNLLINGGFEVSQRGSYTSATAYNDGTYYIDRWETLRDGVTATIQHLVPVSGESSYGIKLTATSSTNGTIRLRQRLEIPNIYKWGARTFTLSARVKSNSNNARLMMYGGSSQGYAYVSGNDSHSGGGEIETLTATFTTTASVSTEFAAFIGIDNIRSASDPAITSGDYFEVYDFQMEEGKVATPFEHRSYGEEFALCQRYYQQFAYTETYQTVGDGQAGTTSSGYVLFRFLNEMRVPPTISHNGVGKFRVNSFAPGQDQICTSIVYAYVTRHGARIQFGKATADFTMNQNIYINTEAGNDAYLYISAEL
tara:strand:- start:157 stop:1140 length:984 start_codon:yes stop_codon:yes gene_type:complete